jgi:hypothetical protein
MNLKLNLHSVIDLITNSSTEMFVTATEDSVDIVKQFINKILTDAGSDKIADDIVTVRLFMDYDERDYDNIDFDTESTPVSLEIKSKVDDTDLTRLITDIFDTKEYMN